MKKYLFSLVGVFAFLAVLVPYGYSQKGEIYKIQHRLNDNGNGADNGADKDSDDVNSPNFRGFSLTTGGTRKVSAMNYHGGPLITTPTVYIIWYGNWNQSNGSDTAAGQQLIRDWASAIGGTPYYNLNRSLSVAAFTITGNVSFTPTANEITDTGTSTSLSDTDIRNIVDRNVGFGKLTYDANGLYFVITSSNVNENTGFCTQYCGWHTAGNVTAGHVRYSFVGNANRCLSACAAQSVSPNNNAGIDGAVSVLSHELEEANTDPDLNAWFDSRGAENADKCAWTFGHAQYPTGNGSWANMAFGGHNWMIQRNVLKTGGSFFCMVNSTQN
jgi:hypothetical protein